jgi:hypothetical protein
MPELPRETGLEDSFGKAPLGHSLVVDCQKALYLFNLKDFLILLARRWNLKIITLYNHKGGVSKTTSTFNLATLMADMGKRVLMVDADPQCNLTEIALARTIAELDEQADIFSSVEVPELPGTSVLDALNQRIQGDAAFIDLSKVKTHVVGHNLSLLRSCPKLWCRSGAPRRVLSPCQAASMGSLMV